MTPRTLALVALFFALLALTSWPLGRYLARVFTAAAPPLARVCAPLERALFRLAGVDATREHTAREYGFALLGFSLVTQLFTYAVLRAQHALPLNPSGHAGVAPWLAFNTATSFTTNTNWQSYAGESTLGYFAQLVALTSQNFFSAAVGLCVAIALLRGIARSETDRVGNFWVDLLRAHLYVLVPLSIVYALFLVWQGVPQTFEPALTVEALDGTTLRYLRGPVASQEAIKLLGTNGGGYFNANSAHPWENPTALTNFVETFSIFVLPGALCVTAGAMVQRPKHGWALFAAMTLLAVAGALAIAHVEQRGNPALASLGVDQTASTQSPGGNMEGKELRFGVGPTALFSEVTTAASCGAVDAMHDSFMPLAGLVTVLNMQLGEVVFGGVGAGLYGVLVYVVLAVFLAGLMVGRTPEYLGKKLDARDVRFAAVCVLVPAFAILGGAAAGLATDAGRAGILNTGAARAGAPWGPHAHGYSEVLYAFSSAAANNGSALAGLTAYSDAHPVFYALGLSLAMFAGRFVLIASVLALAGNMAKKRRVPEGAGSFPVEGGLFVAILVAVILLVGALTFFPALALGPLGEHLTIR